MRKIINENKYFTTKYLDNYETGSKFTLFSFLLILLLSSKMLIENLKVFLPYMKINN